MKLINLTPHVLNVQRKDGSFFQIDRTPSGEENRFLIVRAESVSVEFYTLDGASVRAEQLGKPSFMTCNEKGKDLRPYTGEYPTFDLGIVAKLSLMAIKENKGIEWHRTDQFVSPGDTLRNEHGEIIGCNGFSTL